MQRNKIKNLIFIIIITLIISGILGFLGKPAFASITDGTVDSTYKYVWGENIGWLNFGTTEGNIHVTDSALTGYAWGENIGWISLNPAYGGVANDGAGNLSGYAWSENTGWINFNPTYGGVTINSSGEFLGYAWGENIGWIVFNCGATNSCATVDYKVKTDWRPRSSRPACNNSSDDDSDGKIDYLADPGCDSLTDTNETDPAGGGLPPSASNPPALPPSTSENPEGKFSVSINDNAAQTNTPDVILKLAAGSDTKKMAISNTADFSSASQIPYQEEMKWKLPLISNGEFLISNQAPSPKSQITNYKLQIYAKFYTAYGVASPTVSDSIILDAEPPEIKVSHIDSFLSTEDVIIAGFTEPDGKIGIKLNNSFVNMPPIFADSTGYFSFNLGRLSVGSHTLDLRGTDSAGNMGETLSLNFIVKKLETTVSPKPEPKPFASPVLPKTLSPIPSAPPSLIPPAPAQPREQTITPPSSKPPIEEPKMPPPFSQPSEPQKPTEPIQTKPAESAPAESPKQSFINNLRQSVKLTFENISNAANSGFNNFKEKISGLFKKGNNNFIVFTEDIKALGNEIKFAILESSRPIQISNIKVVSISSTSVKIMWQTNHKATSKVNYGLSRIYDMEKQDNKKVKNHLVILTNLEPGAAYHYEVISQNNSYVYDADRMFITPEK